MMLRVVCRDLKSGNVLVSHALRAKITDFGSIRACFTKSGPGATTTTSTSTSTSIAPEGRVSGAGASEELQTLGQQSLALSMTAGVGTPLYMPPEALVSRAYDAFKADVFSFGVLLWELFSQQRPDLLQQERPGYRGLAGPALLDLLQQGARLSFAKLDTQPGGHC